MRVRALSVSGAVVLAAAGLVAVPSGVALAADCSANPGFYANNDAYRDLAVGAPTEDVGKPVQADAGLVTIVYGNASNSFGGGSLQLTQEVVGGASEKGDRFGAALAVGDLNGDSCYDLVIGVPGENNSAGRIVVGYGSLTGLTSYQSLSQNATGVPSTSEANDEFGASLAIQGTGYLWVGVPGENIGTTKGAGLIDRFPFGTGGGRLPTTGIKQAYQGAGGAGGAAEANDRFGEVLSGSAKSVVVGVPKEDVGTEKDAGVVHVFTTSWTAFSQDTDVPDVPSTAEAGDRFGVSVAQIDSCVGGQEAYLVGSSGEDAAAVADAGAVHVVDLADGTAIQLLQGDAAVGGQLEAGDAFGLRVAASGNLLAAASPFEWVGNTRKAGTVFQAVLGCDANGPTVTASSTTSLNTADVVGEADNGDRFGLALAFARVSGSAPDLVIGAPLKADGNVLDSGRVTVFNTKSGGLFAGAGTYGFGQSSTGIVGSAEKGDQFGAVLAGSAY